MPSQNALLGSQEERVNASKMFYFSGKRIVVQQIRENPADLKVIKLVIGIIRNTRKLTLCSPKAAAISCTNASLWSSSNLMEFLVLSWGGS